ncbi:MAG TPA: RNA polymerase sigma factor [Actinomycetota bacterium]|nr:RNA polymerase sigma factor [Actinomycetota bacterium]
MASPPDEELVRRFLAGDRAAFSTLVERHERRVYNVAYRVLGRSDDAADATQDVFLTCLRKLRGFRGTSAFTTWLHRVTVNACYDALRKRGREEPAEELPDEAAGPDPADQAVAAVDVQRALALVPPEFRVVLVLHDLQGVAYEEIAESLGAPLGTVKSRLHRGRVALARALRGEQPGPAAPSNLGESRA